MAAYRQLVSEASNSRISVKQLNLIELVSQQCPFQLSWLQKTSNKFYRTQTHKIWGRHTVLSCYSIDCSSLPWFVWSKSTNSFQYVIHSYFTNSIPMSDQSHSHVTHLRQVAFSLLSLHDTPTGGWGQSPTGRGENHCLSCGYTSSAVWHFATSLVVQYVYFTSRGAWIRYYICSFRGYPTHAPPPPQKKRKKILHPTNIPCYSVFGYCM